jgi:hypothetical protein
MTRVLAIVLAFAAVAVPYASALELTIYPGVGIGKVRLGMTKAQAEHVLGRDPIVNAHEGAYTEFAWEFASWTVGFEHGHAVQISTSRAGQRTKKGIGFGSTWQAVVRAYPGGRCTWNAHPDFNTPTQEWPEYLVGHRGGSQTLYLFKRNAALVVNEVVVRTTLRALPEFAPGWVAACSGDWRHGSYPGIRFAHG